MLSKCSLFDRGRSQNRGKKSLADKAVQSFGATVPLPLQSHHVNSRCADTDSKDEFEYISSTDVEYDDDPCGKIHQNTSVANDGR
ncbi:hypothetical protein Hypma_011099 [Hypsizygus marmoreus]|uniref:Uncharacterized protein n=1 Tax=Hypsizygus marmoreus TaxID=39966 RepID=A0A369JHW2_HYPMA|nr:hypothetical protein Hypma_011099 [Hypsizygus marmoreus]